MYTILFLYFTLSLLLIYIYRKSLKKKTDDYPRYYLFNKIPLKYANWKYFLLTICDVYGNYLSINAYKYTSIVSVQLLDCSTIIFVLILSKYIFNNHPTINEILGTILCFLGLIILIISDSYHITKHNEQTSLYGDILVLIASFLYAISNVAQEHIIKVSKDPIEFLACIGFWGILISIIQICIFEIPQLKNLPLDNINFYYYFIGFFLCQLLFYILVPYLLGLSSAIMMNLSLTTSDFWSFVLSVLLFHTTVSIYYLIAFTIIIFGLWLYNTDCFTTRNTLSSSVKYQQLEAKEEIQ